MAPPLFFDLVNSASGASGGLAPRAFGKISSLAFYTLSLVAAKQAVKIVLGDALV